MVDCVIGFVPIIRTTFDVPLAEQVVERAQTTLRSGGWSLVGPAAPVTTLEEAQAAALQLSATPLDLLIIFQATFADSTMVMTLARQVDAPLLLWAIPEAATGGRLRLNSLCGINLGGHALTRAGYAYEHLYADPADPAAIAKVRVLAAAGAVRRQLRTTRIGRVGEHPNGFETCLVDRPALRERFGLEIVDVPLHERMFAAARAVPDEQVAAVGERLANRVTGLDALDPTPTHGTLKVYSALSQIARDEHLSGVAVRCWPEFFTDLGCAACGAMSLLTEDHVPASCEADVNGTITQYLLQLISGGTAFGSDIVSVDTERDALIIWHCGLAPLSMADDAAVPGVTLHSNRKLPLLFDFALKPGRVTVARVSAATGEFRLVVGSAEIVRGPKPFSGTCGYLRFERGATEVLNTILSEGLEHHISLTYGDHLPVLMAVARLLKLPVLQL